MTPTERATLTALAIEFVDYYTGPERHPEGGCGNCGGLPHASDCFAGRFEAALAAHPQGETTTEEAEYDTCSKCGVVRPCHAHDRPCVTQGAPR
jgi:hypothetical protein